MNNTMKVDKEEGQIFAAARESVGLTQKGISDKLGYTSPQFISNIERGIARLPAEKFKKLATILDNATVKKIIEARVKAFRRDMIAMLPKEKK